MLLGLVLMAVIGLGFLLAVNKYSNREPLAGIVPHTSSASVSK